ncbi:MAG TPA: NUDIX domain-containing protein [Candidatus Saccharimonadales bacterium]|nr:NUDIX domain-containing protein [Candidatus Saccharimonadales bacterium]
MAKTAGAILILDDGQLVMQRRDAAAPTNPNTLSLFGGHFEDHETPHAALIRELGEETSLPIQDLEFKFVMKQPLHGNDETYIYLAHIKSAHFKVFEGKGAEVHGLKELFKLDDLNPDAREILEIYARDK